MSQLEARLRYGADQVQQTASASRSPGEVLRLADGRAGVYQGNNSAASGDAETLATEGKFALKKAASAGVAFDDGQDVFWDASANTAIEAPGSADDFFAGVAVGAAANADTTVTVDMNATGQLEPFGLAKTREVLLDWEDTSEHILVNAADNPTGLLIYLSNGVVTEQPVGSSEDVLIAQVLDEDDNVLDTLTTSDGTTDAVGDTVKGANGLAVAATGAVAAVCPAGKALKCKLSQVTSGGSPAGALRLHCVVGKKHS